MPKNSSVKTLTIDVRTVGDALLGVYWMDEYYPVEVRSQRLSKDCQTRVYQVKSEERVLTLKRDESTGRWWMEMPA